MGIEEGSIVKAKKVENRVVIEAARTKAKAPYRVYSADEIDEFLKEDKLPKDLAGKAKKSLLSLP